MNRLAALLTVIALVVACGPPASAADVIFPTGSRVGLVPPPGMTASDNFYGYEDRANQVAMVMVPLPPDAYAELERTINPEALKKQGLTLESREPMALAAGKAFLVTGRQQLDKVWIRKLILVASLPIATVLVTTQIPETALAHYPDAVIRTALATLTTRPTVPVEEQLALVPFKVSDLAGFKVAGVVPGRAVMLGEPHDPTPPPAAPHGVAPHIMVALAPGGPQSGDRDHFARDVFGTVPNLKGIRITGSESLRISGQQGHQIMATAQDPATGAGLTVVQWLRFGGGAYLQLVGIAPSDVWKDVYQRFRAVRDGIESR
ncbi:MAG: hypothetical protein AB7S93_16910 [Xanthobacteraceae bacterium]